MPKPKGIETPRDPTAKSSDDTPLVKPKKGELETAYALAEKITSFPPMAAAFRPGGDLVIIAHDGKKIVIPVADIPK